MHGMLPQRVTVAAIQATPVFLDGDATIEKACGLIAEAARRGAHLAVFPEAFVPGYPDWVWVVPSGRKILLNPLYARLLDNAVSIPGHRTDRLCNAARTAGIHVAIGMSERNAEASNVSLYNTLLYIDSTGTILGKHRKLVPTGGERLVWAQGDGSTLSSFDTTLGKIGGLICWENYMPLARYAMFSSGTQIYVAPTWDHGEPWVSTLRHIAKEGGVSVVGCCMTLRRDDIPDELEFKSLYDASKEWINPGGSMIVDADGAIIAGPVERHEEILIAEIDMRKREGSRWILDVSGHYARPDIFDLRVNRTARTMIRNADPDMGTPPESVRSSRPPKSSSRPRRKR